MNEHRLYINGQQVELVVEKPIAYTMQVNDIGDVKNRQSNFSRQIDIPMTPINIQIFEYLGITGNQSIAPYTKLTVDYYVGNDCLIYQGWGQVTLTESDSYKLHIYDGVIDLFKAIENRSLAELNLDEINHDKNLTAVTNSWDNDLNYKYILADYNGKAKYDGGKYNIDYLVPSAKVSYIWDKIFDTYSMTYQGNIFNSEDFQNLWFTYPKGVSTTQPETTFYESPSCGVRVFSTAEAVYPNNSLFIYVAGGAGNFESITTQQHFKVYQGGQYRIRLTGAVKPLKPYAGTTPVNCKIIIAKDQEGDPAQAYQNSIVADDVLVASIGGSGGYEPVDINYIVTLNDHQSFCLLFRSNGGNLNWVQEDPANGLKLEVSRVYDSEVDFNDALTEFKITDFLKEVCWRYSLTIFKDKYTNNYRFLTLDERINEAERIDWSKKFQGVKTEKYIYGDYAQQNVFHHKYNDDVSDYNDGKIYVFNKNLADNKKVIESKIYTPEKELNIVDFQFDSHIYKLWNKEINENDGVQEVKYKELDKRYYFLKSEDYTFSPTITVGSESAIASTSITTAPIESYSGVSYNEVVDNYYSLIGNIISKAKVITAQFNLTSNDVSNFDFAKLYYIDQLGGFFFVNKISNWQEGKLTDVEIIKLENDIEIPTLSGSTGGYDTSDGNAPYITITNYQVINVDAWVKHIVIDFVTNITSSQLKVYGNPIPNSSPYTYVTTSTGFPSPHTLAITSLDETIISNSITWWG